MAVKVGGGWATLSRGQSPHVSVRGPWCCGEGHAARVRAPLTMVAPPRVPQADTGCQEQRERLSATFKAARPNKGDTCARQCCGRRKEAGVCAVLAYALGKCEAVVRVVPCHNGRGLREAVTVAGWQCDEQSGWSRGLKTKCGSTSAMCTVHRCASCGTALGQAMQASGYYQPQQCFFKRTPRAAQCCTSQSRASTACNDQGGTHT